MSKIQIDQDDVQRRLLELSQRTGYEIIQKQGQRVFGPPPGWTNTGPERGSEVYCYRLPRDCFEDELVPVFSSVGKIFELRLMLEFSGVNRSYCYVRYCKTEDAKEAIRKLNNFEIRPDFFLAVTKSVDNRGLVMKPKPSLGPDVTEEAAREELKKILEGVVSVRFISTQWMEVHFMSHKLAAVARRTLVPGNVTIFQNISISQVDWTDPDIDGYATELMNNRNLCVKGLPRGTPDTDLRTFFNNLSGSRYEEQVEGIGRTKSNQVIITFTSPEAARRVMERGEGVEVGGGRLKVSWWLDREVYSSQPWQGSKTVSLYRQDPESPRPLTPLPVEGPVEKLHRISLSQSWGVPRYTCRSFLSSTGQQLYQYSVSVPAVPNSSVAGEASPDRQIAMMSAACSTLQGIATETQKTFQNMAMTQEISQPVFSPIQRKQAGKPGRQNKRLQTGRH